MRCAKPLLAAMLMLALAAGCAAPPKKKSSAARGAQKTSQTAKKPAAKAPAKPAAKAPAAKSGAPAPAGNPAARSGGIQTAPPASVSTSKAPPATAATAPRAPVAGGNPAQRSAVASAAPAPSGPKTLSAREQYDAALQSLKAGQWPAAETGLLAASRAYPQDSGPQTNLGILYARTNRKPQAIAAFRQAGTLNPRNAVAHNWLGVMLRESGDYAGAEQAYRRALQAEPKDVDAQLNLAILYDQYLKRPQDALAAYTRYQSLVGDDDPRPAIWIAELQARLKPEGAAR